MQDMHFFASSALTWATTTEERDLRALIKLMDKEGYPYNLFLVPVPQDTDYEINLYQPQVKGTIWLGTYNQKQEKPAKRSKSAITA